MAAAGERAAAADSGSSGARSAEGGSSRQLARYVAVITDGNGRWAQARGVPVNDGHSAGADTVKARLRDAAVGQLLQLDLGAVLVVGGCFPLGLQLAQVLHRVAAHVADRHATLLGEVAQDLDEVAAALFGQLGHRQAHHVAVV